MKSEKPVTQKNCTQKGMRQQDMREKQEALQLAELVAPRWWVLSLTLVIILLVIWSAMAPIRMVVRAEGRVIPSSRNQVVQHLEGGVVLSINATEGELVQRGDLLARISDVQANSQMGALRVREQSLLAKITRLRAEATGSGQEPLSALNSGIPLGEASEIDRNERAAFLARRQRLSQEQEVASEQIKQKSAELAEITLRHASLSTELKLALQQLQITRDMLRREAASRSEELEAQSRVQRLRTMISDAATSLPRLRAAVGEAKSRYREMESRFRAEASTELTVVQTELQRVQEELKSSNDRVDRTELRAPVAGVINRVSVSTLGGVIRPGDAVMEITPIGGDIVVEASVRPEDRAELRPGLPVHVRLTAYNYASFGAAEGHLTEISADTMPNERGDRFYRVRVSIDGEQNPFARRPIMPGMVATAEIVVGSRTVLAYLISPLKRFARVALSDPR